MERSQFKGTSDIHMSGLLKIGYFQTLYFNKSDKKGFFCTDCDTYGHYEIFYLQPQYQHLHPLHWFCRKCRDEVLKNREVVVFT